MMVERCGNGHEWTDDNTTIEIVHGKPRRACRACHRIRQRRHRAGRSKPVRFCEVGEKIGRWQAVEMLGSSRYGRLFVWECFFCGARKESAAAQLRRAPHRCGSCSEARRSGASA